MSRRQEAASPGRIVFLYEDEYTAHLRPLVGRTYSPQGEPGERATGTGSVTVRLAGALDVATGQVKVCRRHTFTIKEMYRFLYHLEQHYPDAEKIYVALTGPSISMGSPGAQEERDPPAALTDPRPLDQSD